MAPWCDAVHGTNRVGFSNQSGVEVHDGISVGDSNGVGFTSEVSLGAQERISVRHTNRVGFTSELGLGPQEGISVRDPNRVGFTSEFGLGAQERISIRDSNRVGFTSKVGLGPKSFGILGCSGSQVQRKQNERPEYPVSQGTPPRTMLPSGPGSRQVHPIGLVVSRLRAQPHPPAL